MSTLIGISSKDREGWHQMNTPLGEPFFYGLLNPNQKHHLKEWFLETLEKKMIGETSISAISLLSGLIFGNNIRRVVQCGHYAGYSLLVLGMLMENSKSSGRIVSFDIDQVVTRFTRQWINRTQLEKTVSTFVVDSADPFCYEIALDELGGPPELIFIDSSHQYRHTLEELDLWSSVVAPGGFIFLHDASDSASEYDMNGLGGVRAALEEWLPKHQEIRTIICDSDHENITRPVYQDPCGFALLHVPKPSPINSCSDLSKRLISDPRFQTREAWILGDGWEITRKGATKTKGISSAIGCFSPVIEGELYLIEVELSDVKSGVLHPAAGGSRLGECFAHNGHQSCFIKSGGENAQIGLLASADFKGRVLEFSAKLVETPKSVNTE